jgi:glycosyltransferase involved in cell wall biosynthesis
MANNVKTSFVLSVIIPSYHPQEYFYKCLLSIKQQDITCNYEIIVVLNGEKHPYYEKIERWFDRLDLSNYTLLHTDTKGVSNARNIALDLAKGDYIVFIDDDDKVSSNYLSGLLDKIDDSSISLSNECTFYNDSLLLKEGYLANKFEKIKNKKKNILICRSFFSTASFKMIPTNIIGLRRFNTNFANGEDALFMALISDKIKSIRFANEDVIYYRRIRENSASQRQRSFLAKFKNVMKLFLFFSKIYLSSPLKYNILFFATRLIAVFKALFVKSF